MNDTGFRRSMRDVLLSLVVCLLHATVSLDDLAPMTYEGPQSHANGQEGAYD